MENEEKVIKHVYKIKLMGGMGMFFFGFIVGIAVIGYAFCKDDKDQKQTIKNLEQQVYFYSCKTK